MRSFISRKGHFVEGKMFVEWSKSFNKKNNDDDDVVLNGNSFQQLLRDVKGRQTVLIVEP